ncbi:MULTISPECIES: nucleoside hydrolase [Paenibacillus]|uniref:nucleoside hydrolase n=1 Tax=Paenibacillus TaxID=44249 RepID=UPI00088B5E10|nr:MULTISPECIES: nucleoside hydrolase [Paenibacillus]WDQ33880.1 nucleoside hydrolase [Paenibacillus marchantiae]SDM26696.1 purine nucleosidase [Paenibacillus sp. OK060]SHN85464.1 purine nucleosidase [Paenibacillus sp. ov031]SLK19457.1 purine nucleosidase [Paenibacillus sp. RU5A]SOC75753.1 purine nucleosidase [Paenibacillus sp. RU26A]
MTTRKVIMDCDPGHDDAIAIILAAAQPELEILAITTVSGNAEIEKTTQNALQICDLISLNDVVVSKGASEPLVRLRENAPGIHGESGLDGPKFPEPSRSWSEEHGVDTIIRLVKESTEPVTLLPTGPLTNIALALTKAPEIKSNIDEIVLMGGGTIGNWTPTAEFNIWADPEAAKKVFDSGIPTVVMGLDITHQALATKEVIDEVNKIDNHVAKIVGELLVFFASTYKEMFDFDGAPVHDVLTVAYCVAPELFKTKDVNIVVETKGEYTAGTTLVDLHGVTGRKVNAKFGLELDVDGFWKLMIDALKKY